MTVVDGISKRKMWHGVTYFVGLATVATLPSLSRAEEVCLQKDGI
jgi:hypothetical protein